MGNIDQIRTVLNVIFMIGAAASFILYFSLGEDKTIFFYVCGASLFVKMMEFVFRFFLRQPDKEEKFMTKEEIMKPENLVYQKPRLLNDNPMHYCPGCSHGVVHKLIAEVIEEMGMAEKAIGISPVGCAVFMYNYLDIDCQEAAHGRAPALAGACLLYTSDAADEI